MKGIDSLDVVRRCRFFTLTGDDIWKLEMYCEQPYVVLRNVETGAKRAGAVGCLNLAKFMPLIPAGEE